MNRTVLFALVAAILIGAIIFGFGWYQASQKGAARELGSSPVLTAAAEPGSPPA